MLAALVELRRHLPAVAPGRAWQSETTLHPRASSTSSQLAQEHCAQHSALPAHRLRANRITGCWATVLATGASTGRTATPQLPERRLLPSHLAGADTINFHDPRNQAGVIRPPGWSSRPKYRPGRRARDQRTLLMFRVSRALRRRTRDGGRISISVNLMFSSFTENLSKPLWCCGPCAKLADPRAAGSALGPNRGGRSGDRRARPPPVQHDFGAAHERGNLQLSIRKFSRWSASFAREIEQPSPRPSTHAPSPHRIVPGERHAGGRGARPKSRSTRNQARVGAEAEAGRRSGAHHGHSTAAHELAVDLGADADTADRAHADRRQRARHAARRRSRVDRGHDRSAHRAFAGCGRCRRRGGETRARLGEHLARPRRNSARW